MSDAQIQAPTFEECWLRVRVRYRSEGIALRKKRLNNGGNRYDIYCDRAGNRASTATKRKTHTKQCDCRFKGKIRRVAATEMWVWEVIDGFERHNHNPVAQDQLDAVPAFRKLTVDEVEFAAKTSGGPPKKTLCERVEELSGGNNLTSRAMARLLRQEGYRVSPQDVRNHQYRLREDKYGPLTSTQLFLSELTKGDDVAYYAVRRGDDGKIDGVFWTYKLCLDMLKRNPELLMMDNTYKVNRFQMPLFQMVGLSAVDTTFNAAFCLVSAETTDFFRWVLLQLRKLLVENRIPDPDVIITDFDAGLKRAAGEVFPYSKQQLCVWHMRKNVNLNAKKKWEGPQALEGDEEAAAALDADEAVEEAPIYAQSRENATRIVREEAARAEGMNFRPYDPSAEKDYDYNPDSVVEAWRACVYSSTREAYEKAWKRLKQQFHDQKAIISYLRTTYIPRLEEFVDYSIRHFRNYGHKTTSPAEGSHHELKSYLTHRLADLHVLHLKIFEMVVEKQERYKTHFGNEVRKKRPTEKGREIIDSLILYVSFKALDLLRPQFDAANDAFLRRRGLPTCTGAFTKQWGLPCRHALLERLQLADGRVLQPEDVDSHWRLDQEDPELIRIRQLTLEPDPNVVPRNTRRPRRVPAPDSSDDEAPTVNLSNTQREPSAWERQEAFEARSSRAPSSRASATPAPSQAGRGGGRGTRRKQQHTISEITELRGVVATLTASVEALASRQTLSQQQQLEVARIRQQEAALLAQQAEDFQRQQAFAASQQQSLLFQPRLPPPPQQPVFLTPPTSQLPSSAQPPGWVWPLPPGSQIWRQP